MSLCVPYPVWFNMLVLDVCITYCVCYSLLAIIVSLALLSVYGHLTSPGVASGYFHPLGTQVESVIIHPMLYMSPRLNRYSFLYVVSFTFPVPYVMFRSCTISLIVLHY